MCIHEWTLLVISFTKIPLISTASAGPCNYELIMNGIRSRSKETKQPQAELEEYQVQMKSRSCYLAKGIQILVLVIFVQVFCVQQPYRKSANYRLQLTVDLLRAAVHAKTF